MAKSLLQEKLRKEQQEKFETEEKVANQSVLKPSEKEIELSNKVIRAISQKYARSISEQGITALRTVIEKQIILEIDSVEKSYEGKIRLKKLILDTMFGLGPLEQYMGPNSTVTDIIVEQYNRICIKDYTGTHRVEAEFNSEEHLRNVISRIVQEVGRQINLANPAVDAKLKDGSRIHATIPPVTPDGATLTIRRFNNKMLDAEAYLKNHTLSKPMLDFLIYCVKHKVSILVSGGTDSGKTTLLNVLSSYIPDDELIITAEDNCELQLRHPNIRRMEARQSTLESSAINMQDLVRHCLRMCPDRIIVGEVRDGTIVDMLSAMSVGHEGSMSTIHAESPQVLLNSRIPTLFSQYEKTFPRDTQSLMIADSVQLIVQIAVCSDHKRHITHITAIGDVNPTTGMVETVDLFRFNRKTGEFYATGNYPEKLIARLEDRGNNTNYIKELLNIKSNGKEDATWN